MDDRPDDYYVERGYIFVAEDVRGTTNRTTATVDASSAFFGPRNAQDGVDTVNYLAHGLPGSNGEIGLVGCSFLGISELFTAALLGPGSPVKAMVPACAGMDYNLFFSGGIPGDQPVRLERDQQAVGGGAGQPAGVGQPAQGARAVGQEVQEPDRAVEHADSGDSFAAGLGRA